MLNESFIAVLLNDVLFCGVGAVFTWWVLRYLVGWVPWNICKEILTQKDGAERRADDYEEMLCQSQKLTQRALELLHTQRRIFFGSESGKNGSPFYGDIFFTGGLSNASLTPPIKSPQT